MKVVNTFWDAQKEVSSGAIAVYGRNVSSNDFLFPRFLIAETEEEKAILSEFFTNDEFADEADRNVTEIVYSDGKWISDEFGLIWFQRERDWVDADHARRFERPW